jgi:hypothetical protein
VHTTKKVAKLGASLALALFLVMCIALPVFAYLYSAPIAIAESAGNIYTYLPVIVNVDVDWLVANNFITTATALDTRVETSGGVGQIHMAADDKVLAFVPSLPASSQLNWRLTTGNTALTGFPVLTGYNGYIETTDHADLELSDVFEIEFEGWVTATAPYPIVESVTETVDDTLATTHDINLPTGANIGDLLVMLVGAYESSPTAVVGIPSGWTNLGGTYSNADDCHSALFYRVVDGTEGATVALTSAANTRVATQVMRITNYDGVPESTWTGHYSATNAPNPTEHTTSWTERPTLWLATFAGRYGGTVSSYPADYSDGLATRGASGTSYGAVASSQRELATTVENPLSFTTVGSFYGRAITVAISGFPDGIVSKSGAFLIDYDGSTLSATMLSTPNRVVSASVSPGEHVVKVWADGTNLGLDIDGVTEDTTALSGSYTPNTATSWQISSLPYFNYCKHTVDDTFPEVVSRSSGELTTAGTSHPITLPAGVEMGDLLLCIFSSDGNPTVSIGSGAGWVLLDQGVYGLTVTSAVLYKVATGSDALTVDTTASEESSHIVLRIRDGGIPTTAASASGASTNANPPSHTASRPANYLWVSAASWDDIITPSAAPANYSNLTTKAATNAAGASTATAERLLYATTENPGAFTSVSEQWVAWTIAVPAINRAADVLRILYEPTSYIVGTTLPNEESPGTHDGTITWGANPAGVTAIIGGLTPPSEYEEGAGTETPVRDVLPPADVSDWFQEPDISTRLAGHPLRPIVTIMSYAPTITEMQAWRFLGLAILLLVVVGTAYAVRGHYLITGIVAAGAIGLLVQQTIWPLWSLVFIIPAIVSGLLAERTPSI